MSVASYLVAATTIALVVAACTVTGIAGRRRLLPTATGTVAVSATIVLATSSAVVAAEILGTAGWFSRWPLVGLTAVFAAASVPLLGRGGELPAPAPPRPSGPRWMRPVAAVSVALLAAQSYVSIRVNARSGIFFVDALAYHLPWASHFAAAHETRSIVHFTPGGATSYYALNDELMRGMTMALLGRDSAVLIMGAVSVSAVLVAVAAVGAARGRSALALCALAPLVASYGGYLASGFNDWAAIWPLIAALAVLLHLASGGPAPGRPAGGTSGMVVIGLALGLAAGTKYSLLAPAGLLGVGVLVVARGRRLLTAAQLLGGGLLTGGYWYVRNLVGTGSPLPTAHLPGLPHVPMSAVDVYGYSVAHYLGNGHVVSAYFGPGLSAAFGPLWPLLLGLVVAGIVTAVLRPDPIPRIVAAVVVLGLVAYVVTPTTALGAEGHPVLFANNTRYAWPALALGLLLLALANRWRWWPAAVAVLSMAVLVGTLTQDTSWGLFTRHRVVVVTVAVCLLAAAGWALLDAVGQHRAIGIIAAGLLVAGVVGGYPLQRGYLDHRYQSHGTATKSFITYMQRYQRTSIGLVGVREVYAMEGVQWSNRVGYLGDLRSDHSFEDYRTCAELKAAVRSGGYQVVAVGLAIARRRTGAQDWIAEDPGARQVFRNPADVVFEIAPNFGSAPCPAG